MREVRTSEDLPTKKLSNICLCPETRRGFFEGWALIGSAHSFPLTRRLTMRELTLGEVP